MAAGGWRGAPDGSTTPAPPRSQTASALVKALANAHRWKRQLEGGDCASVGELAAAEKVNPSYLSRVLRLTLLVPDIVEAILDGRQAPTVTLATRMEPLAVDWKMQWAAFVSAP